jgi:hypothetical protein
MGGSSAKKAQGPPINAKTPDEESFIKYVIWSNQNVDLLVYRENHSDVYQGFLEECGGR